MRFNFTTFIVLLTFITTISLAQGTKNPSGYSLIQEKVVKAQLDYLSSDWFEGRETGTRGCDMAADYIASMFKIYGLEPAGDVETILPSWREIRQGAKPKTVQSYFQTFSLLDYTAGKEQFLSVKSFENGVQKSVNFNYETDFSVRTSSVGIEIEAPIIFVGYGYKNDEYDYNDFEDVDVKGKVVLRLAGFPGHRDTSSAAYKKFKYEGRWGKWSLMREKNDWAEEEGIIAVIEVDLDEDASLDWSVNEPYRYNTDIYEGTERLTSGVRNRMTIPGDSITSSITTITASKRLAHEIIAGTNINFENYEAKVQKEMKPYSKELKSKKVYIKTTVDSKPFKVKNVLGKIDGKNPKEVIVIGAHYDHVGMNKGYIWNGSDDNASGTVGVLTLAKAFTESNVKPEKTIIFAAWTGEEEGLLGSKYFVQNYDTLNNITLTLNLDMISRDSDDDTAGTGAEMVFTNTYAQLQEFAENFNTDYNLGLDIEFSGSKLPSGGSDHTPFAAKDIPVFYFMAGFPKEYHQPGDHSDLANIPKMTNIIRLGYLMINEFASAPGKLEPMEMKQE